MLTSDQPAQTPRAPLPKFPPPSAFTPAETHLALTVFLLTTLAMVLCCPVAPFVSNCFWGEGFFFEPKQKKDADSFCSHGNPLGI